MGQVFPGQLLQVCSGDSGELVTAGLGAKSLFALSYQALVSSEPVPIRQRGCASLSANDKAAAGLSLIRPAPVRPSPTQSRLHRLAGQNVTVHLFWPNISPSRDAKPLKGQPECLVVDRNAI